MGQLAQCDAMLDGRGSRTIAALSHLGMISMLYRLMEDSLYRGVKSCSDSESGTAAVRPSDPV